MNDIKPDLRYYKTRTVQIRSRDEPTGTLPKEQRLRSFLQGFGTIWDLQLFRIISGAIVSGWPNTAIIVFSSPSAAERTIQSSRRNEDGSFWQTSSILAHPPQIGPAMKDISKRMFSRITSKHNCGQTSSSGVCNPPAKRHRANDWEGSSGDTTTREYVFVSDSSRTATPVPEPESPEWMRARIAQLEVELDSTRAARDMAISELDDIRRARQAEQNAVAQKDAANAALEREKAGQRRLRFELEVALAQKSTLSNDNDALREQLAVVIKGLKLKVKSHDTRLDNIEGRMKKLESGFNRLESDLALTQEQLQSTQTVLASTQASLESMEETDSLTRRRYERTKEKLAKYKEELRNEQNIIQNTYPGSIRITRGNSRGNIAICVSSGLSSVNGE